MRRAGRPRDGSRRGQGCGGRTGPGGAGRGEAVGGQGGQTQRARMAARRGWEGAAAQSSGPLGSPNKHSLRGFTVSRSEQKGPPHQGLRAAHLPSFPGTTLSIGLRTRVPVVLSVPGPGPPLPWPLGRSPQLWLLDAEGPPAPSPSALLPRPGQSPKIAPQSTVPPVQPLTDAPPICVRWPA